MEINGILIDTNAYVEFKKGNLRTIEIIQRIQTIFLCPIVLGELLAGSIIFRYIRLTSTLTRFPI